MGVWRRLPRNGRERLASGPMCGPLLAGGPPLDRSRLDGTARTIRRRGPNAGRCFEQHTTPGVGHDCPSTLDFGLRSDQDLQACRGLAGDGPRAGNSRHHQTCGMRRAVTRAYGGIGVVPEIATRQGDAALRGLHRLASTVVDAELLISFAGVRLRSVDCSRVARQIVGQTNDD